MRILPLNCRSSHSLPCPLSRSSLVARSHCRAVLRCPACSCFLPWALSRALSCHIVSCLCFAIAHSHATLFFQGGAFQLFDSWGVFPGDPGSFVECYNAPGNPRYCSVDVRTDANYVTPGMGICAPQECSEESLQALHAALVAFPDQGEVVSVSCFTPILWSENMTIVAVLCSLLALLIFFATAVDGFMVIGLFTAVDDKSDKPDTLAPLLTSINSSTKDDSETEDDLLGSVRRTNSRRARRRNSMYTRKIWMR